MERLLTIARALAFVLLVAGPVAAQFAPPPIVDPATYRSPSGEYVLDVDPSHIHGAGPAMYKLRRGGRTIWSGQKPFTLLDAAVADDGTVAGYSCSAGLGGFGDRGTLQLLILDQAGAVRLDDRTPRRESMVIDGGPEPNVDGLVFDPDHDRVVFRVSDVAKPEVWKSFALSTGAPGPAFSPASSMPSGELSLSVVDAKPVRGTPLTLVDWMRVDWKKDQQGARFALIDPDGHPVWMLELPTDYQAQRGDRKAQERASRLASTTAILEATRTMEFAIRHATSSERVQYRIEKKEPAGWAVAEVRREPAPDESTSEPAGVAVGPERALIYLGSVKLGGVVVGETGPIRDVHRFDLDDGGRYGFVRRDGACELTLVTGTRIGDSRQIRLGRPGQQNCSTPLVAWAGANAWLVTVEYANTESGVAGWWVDRESEATRPFMLPAGVTSVRAIAGRRGGGVVMLAERESPHGLVVELNNTLFWIDVMGREERTFSDAANSSDSELLSPDDLAVTTSGEILVIDVVRHTVTEFRGDGSLGRTIDLEKSWGREPNYPSGIAADVDGGFIVEDFNAAVPFVRMRADGTVRGELKPRYGDGRPTGRLFRLQAAADGTLWGSDGEAFLQLGDDGLVAGSVGSPASVDDLGEAAAVVVDGADRIYAADRRTGAVHVFSHQGKVEHICRPRPGDVKDSLVSPSLTATHDGRVFLRLDDGVMERSGFLEFSSSGERVARHKWEDQSRTWNPATGGFWAVRAGEVAAVTESGQVVTTVARRADRKWLGWIAGLVVAPDGSLAVAATRNLMRDQEGSSLNLYAPNGEPARLIRLRSGESPVPFAYDGRAVALWDAGAVRIVDTSGEPVARFKPRPGGREAVDWPLFLAAQGRELWMFDASAKTMHRYEMP